MEGFFIALLIGMVVIFTILVFSRAPHSTHNVEELPEEGSPIGPRRWRDIFDRDIDRTDDTTTDEGEEDTRS